MKPPAVRTAAVAQIFNLPYGRFVIGSASVTPKTLDFEDDPQVTNLRYSAARRSRNQNIQQPTSNAQHPMLPAEQLWELDVGCWMFDTKNRHYLRRFEQILIE